MARTKDIRDYGYKLNEEQSAAGDKILEEAYKKIKELTETAEEKDERRRSQPGDRTTQDADQGSKKRKAPGKHSKLKIRTLDSFTVSDSDSEDFAPLPSHKKRS